MDSALLQNLMAGAASTSQFIGGLVVALLYAVIGLLAAIGSIFIFRRIFQGRWEQIFWTSFLVVIAAFYLSFAAYFGAPAPTLRAISRREQMQHDAAIRSPRRRARGPLAGS